MRGKIFILGVLLFVTNVLNAKGVKKLPDWWDNNVYSVMGDFSFLGTMFKNYTANDQKIFRYEIVFIKKTKRIGQIGINRFLKKSLVGKSVENVNINEEDGFIKLKERDSTIWANHYPKDAYLYLDTKILYEIDLEKNNIKNLEKKTTSPFSIDFKKVDGIRTYFFKLNSVSYKIEDFQNKLRFSFNKKFVKNNFILVYKRKIFNKGAISYNVKESSKMDSIAKIYLNNKNYDKAIEFYNSAIEQNKWNITSWANRGIAYLGKKEYVKALENFDFYQQFGKKNSWSFEKKGYAYLSMSRYKDALKNFKSSLILDNKNSASNVGVGLSLRNLNSKDINQCKYFKNAYLLDKENKGKHYTNYCEFDESIVAKILEKYQSTKDKYEKTKLLEEALSYLKFQKELGNKFSYNELSIEYKLALNYLEHSENNSLDKAIKTLNNLPLSNDLFNKSKINYLKGVAYLKQDKNKEALKYFRLVVDRNNSNIWEQYKRVSLYHTANMIENDYEALKYTRLLKKITILNNNFIDFEIFEKEFFTFRGVKEDKNTFFDNDIHFNVYDNSYKQYKYFSYDLKERASEWPLQKEIRLLVDLKRYGEALTCLNKLPNKNNTTFLKITYYKGFLNYLLENNSQAILFLEKALLSETKNETKALINRMIGESYVRKYNKKDACYYFKKGMELNDNKSENFYYDLCANKYSWNWMMGSTLFKTDIYVYKGDKVTITASGRISFGAWAGSSGPEGLTSGLFRAYNRVSGANHGALLCRIGSEADWYIVGREKTFIAERDGFLRLIVNDSDISNNSGDYEGKITIYSKYKRNI